VRFNFIPRNEGFSCERCTAVVAPSHRTFRNHCPRCLTSKHVDDVTPGDRAALCRGLMNAVAIEGTDPDALDIIHACTVCSKISRNRAAPDDDREALFEIMEN